MFKLAVFDMDGTLLNEHDEISEKNRKALKMLEDAGCQIVLASGRQDFLLREYIKDLQIDGPIISCNGAVVRNPITGVTISNEVLPSEIVQEVLTMCIEEQHHYMVYTSDVILASRNPKAAFFVERNKQLDEACQIPIVYDIDPSIIHEAYEVNKVLILEYDEERFKTLDAKLKPIQGIHYCQSNKGHMDIMKKGVSKGHALAIIAKSEGLEPSEIIAFGDNHNDYEMIAFAGCGVAMGNAVDEVKSIADFVSLHHDADGVAYAIEHLLVNKCSKLSD